MGNRCASTCVASCPGCLNEEVVEIKHFDLTAEDPVTLSRPVLPTLMLSRQHKANFMAAQRSPKTNIVLFSCRREADEDQHRLPPLFEESEASSRVGGSTHRSSPYSQDLIIERVASEDNTQAIPLTGDFDRYLEVVFDDDGQDKSVKIYRRPLGAEFYQQPSRPAMITKVKPGTYAAMLGLQPGWFLKAVAGDDTGHLGCALEEELRKLPFVEHA
mmetsp:Transcript_106091/g.167547  ORF Transcript_106091/g.167547 Transcript_106091/m.167547 type:complete len:216 (+) Transcript_106091:51-698(+)|eukprot:CAMPEP_0169083484 /NCGR_PEP_ID=MMETSP1015-20121227/12103_1 /TAXON_ID=342587 /ORGANISM="Karlodinium micrum, Strain CCMP2283" /LENGTH=215 /DNA_ID=CAMNT_0009143411 /DNA_START=45 /DNA_END=692 /DNA_ORIENTATION=-